MAAKTWGDKINNGVIMKKLLLISAIAFLLGGCATHKTTVNVVVAPKIADAARFETIAVANFQGLTGASFSHELESLLVNAQVHDKPVYRSVQRTTVPASRNFSSGDSDQALLRNAANNNAQAVIAGDVLKAESRDERTTENRFVCDKHQKADGVLAQMFAPCESGRDVKVNCTTRKGDYTVAFRLLDIESKKLIASQTVSESSESKVCSDEKNNLAAPEQLIAQSKSKVLTQLRDLLVPRQVQMELDLMPTDDLIQSASNKEKMEGALRFAKEGRFDRACEIFRKLRAQETQSIAIQFNLGICAEADDDPISAQDIYRQLDKQLSAPNTLVNTALKRVDERAKVRESLAQIRGDLLSTGQVQTLSAQNATTSDQAPAIQKVPVSISGKRVALVIGNSRYLSSPLPNPVNDARDMGKLLQKLGFTVVKVEDGSLMQMKKALDQFASTAKNANVAMVFYAGHGIQFKGENFLIPVDAVPKTESDVTFSSLNMGQVLSVLEDSKAKVNLVIMDACRNNPFARSWRSASGKNGGLASVDAPIGTLVAYSTAPGKTAEDGSGRNGLYTGYLLKELTVPNQRIEDVFKNVRKAVVAATDGDQTPWESSSLTGDLYFAVSK